MCVFSHWMANSCDEWQNKTNRVISSYDLFFYFVFHAVACRLRKYFKNFFPPFFSSFCLVDILFLWLFLHSSRFHCLLRFHFSLIFLCAHTSRFVLFCSIYVYTKYFSPLTFQFMFVNNMNQLRNWSISFELIYFDNIETQMNATLKWIKSGTRTERDSEAKKQRSN